MQVLVFQISNACYLVCDFNPSFLFLFLGGFTGFHLQPEDVSQFPAFVALHPRPLLFGGTCWSSNCSCINWIVIAGYICLHISICTHWMGNPFGQFSSSVIFFLLYIYILRGPLLQLVSMLLECILWQP